MKSLIVLVLALAYANSEMLITPDYIEYLKSTVSWEVTDYEDNLFKGWTVDEIKDLLKSYESPFDDETPLRQPKGNAPTSISWAGSACTHDVRNQGSCSSDWAFSVASVVADICCSQTEDYGWLSAQELVSCDRGNKACEGGTPKDAFFYVRHYGLVDEKCYPYKAKRESCPGVCADGRQWNVAHHCVCQDIVDCSKMENMRKCLETGPFVATITVYKDFLNYKSGIYCWNRSADKQGIMFVRCIGYQESPEKHFECVNSWGTSWGDKGLFKIKATSECGISMELNGAISVDTCL